MSAKFFVSSNPSALESISPDATVEAEYGDVLVSGRLLTMAHHGPRSNNPAPCSGEYSIPDEGIETVGISHLDLDTLGGCMAILGRYVFSSFWDLAAFVDVNGPHKLGEANASPEDLARLYAFWAYNENNRVFAPRDGSVLDVTAQVLDGVAAIEKILGDDPEMLAAGAKFKEEGEKLNAASFVEAPHGVILRVSPGFTNHLYTTPSGKVCKAVVAYNTLQGSITVSFADTPTGSRHMNAREIVQSLWGQEAGGHAGIAGSPRGQKMTLMDVAACYGATIEAVCPNLETIAVLAYAEKR
jgi:hypothetical protein